MSFIHQSVEKIKADPGKIFWAFALTHLVLWTLIPCLVSPNLPVDVIEGYAWGKEWLIGTHKHPPMQAWILEILFTLTGHAKWTSYLASQIAIVSAFWAVWQTGRRIAGEKVGLIGAMMLEGIIYYNFTSPELNPNVLQIPFWALAGYAFHKAVKGNRLQDWLLLGLWAAAGMYTKYSTGLFLLVLFIAMLSHRDGRARFKSPGPYLTLATAVALFMPHLLWLIHSNFLPLEYTEGRLERHASHYSTLLTTALMVAGQLLALMFAALLVLVLYERRRPARKIAPSFDRIFLNFAAFGPFVAMLCMSLMLGYHIRDMWETPFWNFIGLWAIIYMRPALAKSDLRRFALVWGMVFCLGLVAFAASEFAGPYFTIKPKRTIFPGKHMSHFITDTWHNRFHTPLKYVIGDTWPAGNVAWYADERPHVFMDADTSESPWIDVNDLKKSGGVIIWCVHCGERNLTADVAVDPFQSQFPQAQIQAPINMPRMTDADVPPVVLGWAIIPPEQGK
jgi:hypothetical protein